MAKYQGRATVDESECTALIWALQSACGLGYKSIEFEGDNLNIVRLINGKEDNPMLRHYLETIWSWRSMFTTVKFTFRHREQNKCADMLARKAIICNNNGMMFHSCPTFLAHTVNTDIGHLCKLP